MQSALEKSMIRSRKDDMISFLHVNPQYLPEALELCTGDKQPFCWRAAWLLQNYLEPNSPGLRQITPKIIAVLPNKKDGHQRELLKLLKLVSLNEEQEGELYEICLNIWMQIHKNPSVRYLALEFVIKIAKKYPELFQELALVLTEEYIDSLSPGIKHGVKFIIKTLKLAKILP